MSALTAARPETMPQDGYQASRLSVEWVVYGLLLLLSLVLRLAPLEASPLSQAEATQALAAWHTVFPNAAGDAPQAVHPMSYSSQVLSFTLLGGSDFAARLPLALAGVLLGLAPLLFRARLGAVRTFAWSLILTLATSSLAASQTSGPGVWSALCALVFVWAWLRQREQGRLGASLGLAVAGALWLFVSEAGAVVFVLISAGAAWLAYQQTLRAGDERQLPERSLSELRAWMTALPWGMMLVVVVLVVFSVATLFGLNLDGLSVIGQALAQGIAGLWTPAISATFGYGLVVALAYEGWYLLLAFVAWRLLVVRGRVGYGERLALWMLPLVLLVLLIYRGAHPSYALWLVLPASYLVAGMVEEWVVNRPVTIFWGDRVIDEDLFTLKYSWVKWALAGVVVCLWVMMATHFYEVGREITRLTTVQVDVVTLVATDSSFATLRQSLVWLPLTGVILFVGFFLVGSIWGDVTAWQALGLGTLMFALVTGVGGAWNISHDRASNPMEYWYGGEAVQKDAALLRQTIGELAKRETLGFPSLPVTVVEDGLALRSDGLVAWLLRDYPNTSYVASLEAAQGAGVIIAPLTAGTALEGYVGQSFAIRRDALPITWHALDIPSLLTQRRLRAGMSSVHEAILWLRADVYQGTVAEGMLR